VLAIVEHDQKMPTGGKAQDRIEHGPPGLLVHPEPAGDHCHDGFGVGHCCQIDPPDTVPEMPCHHSGYLDGQASFSYSWCAAQRHEPLMAQGINEVVTLVPAAYEAAHRPRNSSRDATSLGAVGQASIGRRWGRSGG